MKLASLARAAVFSLAFAACGRSHGTHGDAGADANDSGGGGSTATAGADASGGAGGAGGGGAAGAAGASGSGGAGGGGAGGSLVVDGGGDVADAGHDAAGGAGQDGAAKDSGPDGAAGRPADTCAIAADCPGGACWLHLDGSKSCVTKVKVDFLSTCQSVTTRCCLHDTDCTTPTAGLCVPNGAVTTTFCGGFQPLGNTCRSDECAKDADCDASKPAGTAKAACFPSGVYNGARNLYTATCVFGACRTDADCAQSAGGRCSYGLAPTHGVCNLQYVTYCAYPSDPCHLDGFTTVGCEPGLGVTVTICVPQDDLQGMHCGPAPPMIP
jgi:hypothetical protein